MKLKLKLSCPGCSGDGRKGTTDECSYCFGEGFIEQVYAVISYEEVKE